MKRVTRILVAALSTVMVLGLFSAPASSVESTTSVVEDTCDALEAPTASIADVVEENIADAEDAEEALGAAKTALNGSSTTLGTAGLAYVKALDGTGNERTTLAAYTAAATAFSEDIVEYLDAVEAYSMALKVAGVNSAGLNFLTSLCPAAAAG